MINCPRCDIAFSPSFPVCPRCKAFDTPAGERKRYLTQDARIRIEGGESPSEVRQHLLANGFSDAEADVLVGESISSVRAENRGHGCRRFVIGVLMLGLAGIFVGIVWSGARARGNGLVIGMVTLLGGGSLAVISGIYTMISGRESKTVGSIVERVECTTGDWD